MKQILSIQSAVLHGYVGNETAALIYPALGFGLARIDTVRLAAHPGHGPMQPAILSAAHLKMLLNDFCQLPTTSKLHALHSGYLASPEQGERLAAALPHLSNSASQDFIYLLDPVLGDGGQFYVAETIADVMRSALLPQAQIITPNAFELSVLSGVDVSDLASAERAARQLLAKGPHICLATGLTDKHQAGGSDIIDMMVIKDEAAHHYYNKSQSRGISGAGDCLAALLLGFYLSGKSPAEAASRATSITHDIIASADDHHDMPLFAFRHLISQ